MLLMLLDRLESTDLILPTWAYRPPTKKLRRLIGLYIREQGLCYWCEEPMILELDYYVNKAPPKKKVATLDHLRDRYNPTRYAPLAPGEKPTDRLVAACFSCNNIRGRKITEGLSYEERKALERRARAARNEYMLDKAAAMLRRTHTRSLRPPIYYPGGGKFSTGYQALPPVTEQGPRPGDHPIFFREMMREAAE